MIDNFEEEDMFTDFDVPTRKMLTGNLLMILCCVFYLAWWLLAFKPTAPVKGMKSGWLLIPALLLGVAAVWQIGSGSGAVENQMKLLSGTSVLIGGVVAYIILLAGTSVLLKRQVTTELFLIVGWAVLMFLELNALHGMGPFTKIMTVLLLAEIIIAAIVSLICYLLYYNLDRLKGYVDGMIPLLLIMAMMAVVTIRVIVSGGKI
ncbi:MAG: hypothetical protein LUE63_06600 [Lachnospiraceae bacterium]|nr:hypothetical protein [Lachnospiraceae bacterium]